jgi:voltage-gated potassium channel Kch
VLGRLWETLQRRRFAWLLGLLLAVVGIDPVLEAIGLRGRAIEWMLALALAAAVGGAWRVRGSRWVAAGAGATLVAWLALHLFRFGPGASFGPALLGAASLGVAALLIVVVLGEGRVDAERICAALCVYLLAGIAFGGLYAALESSAPGSLRGAPTFALGDAVYFSFVTLATLGYGDITPAASAARALAVLEAVFGQLYLAVLIARLVGLYAREP